MKKSLLFLMLLFILSSHTFSQWALTSGADVYSLTPSPDGNLYAGTRNGIYRSDDNGSSWQILNLITSNPSIAVNQAGNVFAIRGNEVFRSMDAGDSWEFVVAGLNSYSAIAFNSQGHIIAANDHGLDGSSLDISTDNGQTWVNKPINMGYHEQLELGVNVNDDIFIATDQGLMRSSDSGESWVNITTLSYIGNPFTISMAFNSSGDIFIGSYFEPRVYRSTDNGDTWSLVFISSVRDIAINVNDELIIGGHDIYRSINDGESWTPVNEGLTSRDILSLCVDSLGNIFAGTKQGIFKSINNGQSWEPSFSGLPGDGALSFASNALGDLYAIADSLYVSRDNGENWFRVDLPVTKAVLNTVKIHNNDDIYVIGTATKDFTTYGILLRSTDNGQTWVELTNKMVSDIAFTQDNQIYIISEGEIFRSTDSGESWSLVVTGLECLQPSKITISLGGLILVNSITCESSTYMSVDNGETWLAGGELSSDIISMTVNSIGDVFVVTQSSGVYRSLDNGSSWQNIYEDPGNYDLRTLVADQLDNLYLATSSGIFVSNDNGDTWEEFNEGLHVTNILSIHVSNTGYLYTSTLEGGVWIMDIVVSTNNPDTPPSFSIYPNPARYQFTLNSPEYNPAKRTHISIFSIQGKLIKEIALNSSSMAIDINGLSKGVYIVKITGNTSIQKLIIQ